MAGQQRAERPRHATHLLVLELVDGLAQRALEEECDPCIVQRWGQMVWFCGVWDEFSTAVRAEQ